MPLATDTATCPTIYRPRHPAATVMHRTVRMHLETFLALAQSRDLCPSCGTRRMVETAAHLVDACLLQCVPYRQWVVDAQAGALVPEAKARRRSSTGRRRWRRRAVGRHRASPDAPRDAKFGAILFVHRFGDALNSHWHFHVPVTEW